MNEKHSVVSDSLRPHGLNSPWNSLGQNTGVGSPSLLQGIFPTQGSNPGLPHSRRILYELSHKGTTTCTVDNHKSTSWKYFTGKDMETMESYAVKGKKSIEVTDLEPGWSSR